MDLFDLNNNEYDAKPLADKMRPNNIVEFCTIPRCYYEVRKAFAINDYTCRKIVNKFIEDKKLALTAERINSHRKLIKNG